MAARVNTVAFLGFQVLDVDVQVHISSGLPAFTKPGLPGVLCSERTPMSAFSHNWTSSGASEVRNRVYGKPPLNPLKSTQESCGSAATVRGAQESVRFRTPVPMCNPTGTKIGFSQLGFAGLRNGVSCRSNPGHPRSADYRRNAQPVSIHNLL